MLVTTTLAILLTSELCLSIRVPVTWEEQEPNSEVKNDNENFSVETIEPQTQTPPKQIPVEYFEYTAKKPQFAVDIASFHGVQSPENHYKAYPIEPYTGVKKPELGRHKHVNEHLLRPIQEYGEGNEDSGQVEPVSSSYEVFHPYEAEVPGLQELYKDPIMTKIRNDLESNKNRLQKYESDAGEPNISKDEYLESPHKTDSKLFPHRNVPVPYEIHRPQRRPVYYRPGPRLNHRDQYLNHKLRHPWNQYVKVKPMHYRPIKNHIHHLRQNHALKYDDEHNEYPQVHALENYSDPKDGYDIYEKGRDKFVNLRNNVDESINRAVKENRPSTYERLEIQNDSASEQDEDDSEEEFVPIKNYAQVRRTETYKHLPRSAALADAESYDEIRNAPRLREAVKSTKAQTVYSEEGYEDAAYDHAGEQKHAEENEGHGGLLKQHELSGGKYKTPSVSGSHDDAKGSIYRDKLVHDEKWKDDNLDNQEENEEEDYTEKEHEQALEADNYQDTSKEDENHRNKRENNLTNDTETSSTILANTTNILTPQHELDKRDAKLDVPEIDFNSTFLSEKDILKIGKLKLIPKKSDIKHKYPYYFKNLKSISRHSPLRYAENLKFIPKKSKGGTEFYDSRSSFKCPEVEEVPDPVPEKLKDGNNPDETDSVNKGEENFDTTKKQPRLQGLGDKIDCFRAKFFGEDPLDSPFFKEDIILNPEPVTAPNTPLYKLLQKPTLNIETELKTSETKPINLFDLTKANFGTNTSELQTLIDKLRNENQNRKLITNALPALYLNITKPTPQTNIYTDVIDNIQKTSNNVESTPITNHNNISLHQDTTSATDNVTYQFFQAKEDVTKSPLNVRKKRATSFVYEPYKIIRDTPVQDSKKTTTTSNISPLIKQLQSSRVVDRVAKSIKDSDVNEKEENRNARTYKDIGRTERKRGSKNDKPTESSEIVDVEYDKRRGEPRYEVRLRNHKSEYTPVENKKAMSIEDYKNQTHGNDSDTKTKSRAKPIRIRTTVKPYFDVNHFIPQIKDVENVAASNTVRKRVTSSTTTPKPRDASDDDSDDDEDYEEYDDDEEEEEDEVRTTSTTTTTTTPKPSFRRRARIIKTTEKLPETTEKPILQLVTRFRDYKHEPSSETKPTTKTNIEKSKKEVDDEETLPKYREKKKKSSKSTIVTDIKKYGNDDEPEENIDPDDEEIHDMRKDEVDALIGVKQDMNDYMPSYEKKSLRKSNERSPESSAEDDDEDDEDEDEDEDDDDEEDDDEDVDDEEDENDEDYEDASVENKDEVNKEKIESTTPEPTKRTLTITTDAPAPTVATRSAKLELKPIITKKKFEIHNELPVNKSSPHVTHFKQDIKEVEIVKEMPSKRRRRPNKNVEALELYKDDKLAEEVNKLGAVEVFKENLNLKAGPKHGGNYRSALKENEELKDDKNPKSDPETSQSEFKKHVELEEKSPAVQMHGGHLKSNPYTSRRRSKSSKFNEQTTESADEESYREKEKRKESKSEKLIELEEEEEEDDDDSSGSKESYSRNYKPMHGGNYRSANLEVENTSDKSDKNVEEKRESAKNGRRNAAVFLNSFASAVPVLTTTPSYILDPSKRMYYYVDA